MEKFGLRPNHLSHNSAIELAIAQEQASALGRAGKALRLSLERYQSATDSNFTTTNETDLIHHISECLYALILQREFIGFIEGNLEWIEANYTIPEEAMTKIGIQ